MSRSNSPTTFGGNGQTQWPQQGHTAPPQRQPAPQGSTWNGQSHTQPPYRGQPADANGQYYPSLDPRQAPPQSHDYAPQFGPADFGAPHHAQMPPGLATQSANGWVGGVVPQPEAPPYSYPGADRTGQPHNFGRPADYSTQAPQYPQYAHDPQYGHEPQYAQPAQPHYGDPRTGPPPQPALDPRGYDLGNYAPAHAPAQGAAYGQPAYGQPYPDAYQQQGYPQQGQPGAPMGFGNTHATQQHAYEDEMAADGTEEYEDDEEHTSGARKWLMVTAALVVALAVGGGGMYAYKVIGFGVPNKIAMFTGRAGAPPPTIAADKTPTKFAPEDAGGRDFANKEKTLYERFGETRTAENGNAPAVPGMVVIPPPQQASELSDPSSPRTVKTITISPSGQEMQPNMAAPTQPLPRVPNANVRPNNGPLPQVPGMSLENMGGRAGFPGDAQGQGNVAPQTQQRPLVKTAAVAPPNGFGAAPASAAQAAVAPQPQPAVKKVVAAAKPAGAPVPKVAQPASAGGSGYVAWVTSHQNQSDAIAQFANLKQKYPDLMANKQPDIKTADLKDKGTWYRVRIGPSGSKAEMDELCLKLKASGVKDCYPQHQ